MRRDAGARAAHARFFLLAFLLLTQLAPLRWLGLEPTFTEAADTGSGTLARQIGYFFVFLLAVAPWRSRALAHAMRAVPVGLAVLAAWFATTLLWSPFPGIGLRRLLLTVVVGVAVLALARRLAPIETTSGIRDILALIVALSAGVSLLLPETGVHQAGLSSLDLVGDWRGIFSHKNHLGVVAAMSALYWLSAVTTVRPSRFLVPFVVFSFSAAVVVMSDSRTSLGLLVASIPVLLFLVWANKRRRPISAVIAVGLLALVAGLTPAAVVLQDVPVSGFITPDSFTGRGLIWSRLLQEHQANEFLGRGYMSLFAVGGESALAGFGESSFFETIAHAHNAYLEIYLSTGWVGLVMMIFTAILLPVRAILRIPAEYSVLKPLFVTVALYVFAHWFMEAGAGDRDRATWVMLLFIYGTSMATRSWLRPSARV